MLKEFRDFALKGNVLDMAVGIIIGAAFTAIVSSLVEDVIMPPIGVLLGGVDFSDWFIQMTRRETIYNSLAQARDNGAAALAVGSFLNAVIKFLIVAFAVFMLVRNFNKLRTMLEKKQDAEVAASPLPADVVLLTEIRDLLAKKPDALTP